MEAVIYMTYKNVFFDDKQPLLHSAEISCQLNSVVSAFLLSSLVALMAFLWWLPPAKFPVLLFIQKLTVSSAWNVKPISYYTQEDVSPVPAQCSIV